VVVLIGLWMLFASMSLVDTGDWFVVNYLLTSPLLIGALYMDRHRVRAAGSDCDYIESSRLLGRWIRGRGVARGGVRICLLLLFFASQIPVAAVALWYVAIVRRRAFRGADQQEETQNGTTIDPPPDPREHVRARIEEGRERVERAENLFEGGNYHGAYETFEEAIDHFENVLASAIEYDLDEERTEVDLTEERTELDALIRVCTRNANEARRALYNVGDVKPELTTVEEFQAAETVSVFFSYSSDDRSIVERIKDGIEARTGGNVDVYRYEDDPQPGKPTWTKAKNRIREADLFLVLLTPNSQGSAWVQQEVGFAAEKVPIVPILRETGVEPELVGLLESKEYLTFAPDSPDDFLEDFMNYAGDTWDVHPDE
jgi:hypothetical protein